MKFLFRGPIQFEFLKLKLKTANWKWIPRMDVINDENGNTLTESDDIKKDGSSTVPSCLSHMMRTMTFHSKNSVKWNLLH